MNGNAANSPAFPFLLGFFAFLPADGRKRVSSACAAGLNHHSLSEHARLNRQRHRPILLAVHCRFRIVRVSLTAYIILREIRPSPSAT